MCSPIGLSTYACVRPRGPESSILLFALSRRPLAFFGEDRFGSRTILAVAVVKRQLIVR
jgi:hypothetical protein